MAPVSRSARRFLVLLSVATVSCSSVQAELSGSYTNTSKDWVQCATLTVTGSEITGYFQTVQRTGKAPNGYSVSQARFVGKLSNQSFSLRSDNFALLFGGTGISDCSGKFSNGSFHLNVPQPSGQTLTMAFKRSTTQQWNKVVADFQAKCRTEVTPKTNKVRLGKLGEAKEATEIYAQPDTTSKIYYRLKPKDRLVVHPGPSGWVKVLLQNGQFGYVPESKVKQLPFEVTTDRNVSG